MNLNFEKIPSWMLLVVVILFLAITGYAVIDNREVQYWPPKVLPKAPSVVQEIAPCEINACIKSDGSCGAVHLWGGATYDRQSHGYDVRLVKPAQGTIYYSSKPVGNGMFVGTMWECK